MKYLSLIILLLTMAFGSCKTTNLFEDKHASNKVEALDSVFINADKYEYHIRKDDKISISIWGQDELSVGSAYGIYNSNEVYGKWLMVDANGNVEIPKLGTVKVENLTIIQLKNQLKNSFGEWIKTPVIDVKILNREITVLGEVRDPQVLTVDKENNTLLDAIAKCKGFEFYANLKYIKVLRQVGNDVHIANIDLSQHGNYAYKNIALKPGDVVVVPSKKYKEFDRRIATIIPFTTALSAAGIFMGVL